MSSDKFHCTNGHCLTDCVLSSIDYDKDFPPEFCPHSGVVVCWKKCETTEKKPTVFQRITASPEVLAKEFCEEMFSCFDNGFRWFSMLTGEFYNSKPEAIAATVEKLKEECK